MKESSNNASADCRDLITTVTEAEFEAAMVLLELRQLILASESRPQFSFTWGAKRKRSYVTETTPTPFSSSPPSVKDTTVVAAAAAAASVGPTCEKTEEEKPKALSPATPLLFCPSESDDKSKQKSKRKVNFKRKKEEYLKMIEELTESNRILKAEKKNLSCRYDEEKALNLKLKAMEERINHGCLQMEQPQQTQVSLNHAMELAQPTGRVDIQDQTRQSQYTVHQQPIIMDQTAHNSENPQYPYGQNLFFLSSKGELFMANDNKVGRSVTLDLNVSLEKFFTTESSQAFNVGMANKSETKALAAQARRRRIQICRSKNNPSASKLRHPVCR